MTELQASLAVVLSQRCQPCYKRQAAQLLLLTLLFLLLYGKRRNSWSMHL